MTVGLFVLGFGVAFGIAAWRNMPTLEGGAVEAVVFSFGLALVAAFFAGRRAGAGAAAGAVAQAHAESQSLAAASTQASQLVNVFVREASSHPGQPAPDAAAAGPAAAIRRAAGLDALPGGGLDVDSLEDAGALEDAGLLVDED